MRRLALLGLGLWVAGGCGDRQAAREAASDTTVAEQIFPRDSVDSALITPRLVTEPTVIIFWLPVGSDTLHPEDAASAQDDLDYYTEKITGTLAVNGIKLYPTNSDTVYVALPNHQRRTILLSGLDYPYGYVLIEPGDVEHILTGVYDDESLLDEIKAYFEIDDDSTAVRPKIST